MSGHRGGREDRRDANKRVEDEEKTVDQRVKSRILDSRDRVEDAEAYLFVDGADNQHLSDPNRLRGYATVVRQYVRNILPLLVSDDIPESRYYREEVVLMDEQFLPPEGEYPWPEIVGSKDRLAALRSHGLPPSINLPEPKPFTIQGLAGLLDQPNVHLEWHFRLNNAFGPAADTEDLEISGPLPKQVYDRAVQHADQFLQQSGLGLEIGHRKKDEADENPF